MPKINIKSYLRILGLSKLKPKQKEIINLILKKKDIIGILPTGYGKSLCYMLPFLIRNKNVIIISPLISLMKDQYDKLKEKNIETIVFNSSFSRLRDTKEGKQRLNDIYNKKKKFLMYFSPESFIRNRFLFEEMIKLDILSLVATIKTQTKIKKILDLKDPILVKATSYKDNLELFVKEKTDGYISDIYSLIMANGVNNKCIIYCKTKADTELISNKLRKMKIAADFYHAGLPNESRDMIQNEINIIVATIAFGMGIDIPDIHLIIHYGISKNIESYYQEIGRGGRDGKQVKCYVFWSKKDLYTNRFFIKQIENEEFRKEESLKVNELDKYLNTSR
jgi:ATP-dependent DNA helicase RecQ